MDVLLSFSALSYTVVLATDVPPAGPEQATGAASRQRPPGTQQTSHYREDTGTTPQFQM